MEQVTGTIDWRVMYQGRMNGGMRWLSALSELIDNSQDAGADMVKITYSSGRPRRFSIQDNGSGAGSLNHFFGFGTHNEHKGGRTDPLGVWGVGGTHSTLWVSHDMRSRVTIRTRTKESELAIDASWKQLALTFNRGEGAPAKHDENVSGNTGTTIMLEGPLRQVPHGADFEKLLDDLSFRYSRAVEAGTQVIFERGSKASILKKYEPPPLTDVVNCDFEVNGKRVRLMAGIVPQGTTVARSGLHYRYSYRVIKESSADGCGEYSGSRIFGFVDLFHGWKLDLHKDSVTDKDARALYAAVYERIQPLLEKAKGQLMMVESASLVASVTQRLNEALADTEKARRGKGGKRGRVKPRNTGRRHRNAGQRQDGSTMPPATGHRIGIEFTELEDLKVGDYQSKTIRLNTRLAGIERIRRSGNEDAIFAIAMSVYHIESTDRGFARLELGPVLEGIGAAMSDESAKVDSRLLSAVEVA